MEESFESEWEVQHTLMGGGRAACAKDSFLGEGSNLCKRPCLPFHRGSRRS